MSAIDDLIAYVNEYNSNINTVRSKKINLIIDGSAFMGYYVVGIVYYLKTIKDIEIDKISCVSSGSSSGIYAVCFHDDQGKFLHKIINDHDKYLTLLEEKKGNYWETYIDLTKSSIKDDDHLKCTDKLYITHRALSLFGLSRITESSYDSKDKLLYSLYNTGFIPLFGGKSIIRKDNSYNFDGFLPYVWTKNETNNDILRISPFLGSFPTNWYYTPGDKDRAIKLMYMGILDAHQFMRLGKNVGTINWQKHRINNNYHKLMIILNIGIILYHYKYTKRPINFIYYLNVLINISQMYVCEHKNIYFIICFLVYCLNKKAKINIRTTFQVIMFLISFSYSKNVVSQELKKIYSLLLRVKSIISSEQRS